MKVIKPGREQHGWVNELTCTGNGNGGGGCDAVLLVEEDDVYQTYDGSTDYYLTFRCPQCNAQTDIENAPSSLIRAVKARAVAGREI